MANGSAVYCIAKDSTSRLTLMGEHNAIQVDKCHTPVLWCNQIKKEVPMNIIESLPEFPSMINIVLFLLFMAVVLHFSKIED